MRQIASVVTFLVLLAGGLTTAHTAPLPGPAPRAYCGGLCCTTTWSSWTGQSQYEDHGSTQLTLQAELAILVSASDHGFYCGEVKAQAHDDLLAGCATISGYVQEGINSGGSWSEYHCTDKEYDITGPAWFPSCTTGQSFIAWTTDNFGDGVASPTFNC